MHAKNYTDQGFVNLYQINLVVNFELQGIVPMILYK